MNISYVTFFLTLNIVFVLSDIIPLKPCKPPGLMLGVHDVKNCTEPPCTVKKLSSIEVEITFTPTQDYEKLFMVIQATIMGITHGFPGYDGKEACDYLYTSPGKQKAGCPLKAGQEYIFNVVLVIPKQALKLTFDGIWALKDKKSKNNVVCAVWPLKIT